VNAFVEKEILAYEDSQLEKNMMISAF